MRKTPHAHLLIAAGLLALVASASAQVPETMSFQGQFATTSGVTPNSTNTITFAVYDASTGGTSLWSESQSVSVDASRRFNVILGSSTPLSVSFDGPRWIGITVGTGSELTPRIELTSSAYSLQARDVDDDAITSAKIDDGAIATADLADNAVTAAKITTGGAGTGLALVSNGSATPVWGPPTAQDFVLPFSKTSSSSSTLWSLTNSGTGGAGSFAVANASSPAAALTAATNGTGSALDVSGRITQSNGSVLFSGGIGATPASGAGERMMWIPSKAAFRAGFAGPTSWNADSIGQNSAAFGVGTQASGGSSFAAGNAAMATGTESIALGPIAIASGYESIAMGRASTASGNFSAAIGVESKAIGNDAVALGSHNVATGFAAFAAGGADSAIGSWSTAMGNLAKASGFRSTAIGYSSTASGDMSTTLGSYASTNGKYGSFVYGDFSTPTPVLASAHNQFVVRASGGTVIYSDSGSSAGKALFVAPGGNVGVGTSAPTAKLAVAGSVLSSGATGSTPVSGMGVRMMWVPSRKAFRAGELTGQTPANEWDDANLGQWSAAFGVNTLASGTASIAAGNFARATGEESVAIGGGAIASGHDAVALGLYATASGAQSVALGNGAVASGPNSTAIGSGASTNGHNGAFIYGDGSGGASANSADNQFMVRASGGSVFFTNSSSTSSSAVYFAPGGNVGLGTASPVAKLDVAGSTRLVAGAGNAALTVAGGRMVASLGAAAGGTTQATAVAIGADVMTFDVQSNGTAAQATASLPTAVDNGTMLTVTTSDPNGAVIYFNGPAGATSYAFYTGSLAQFVRVGGSWHVLN